MHPSTDHALLLEECAAAETFEQLVAIALREARKFPGGCHIVCGPISTGGRGSIDANIKVFASTIDALRSVPYPIFNQVPYEAKISELRLKWIAGDPANRTGQYYTDILTCFYLPLFESGAIVRAWFIPDWASSHGACWERETLGKLSVELTDLNPEWLEDFMLRA